jgi:integrase
LRWSDLDLDAGRAAIRQTVIAVKHTAILGTPKIANGRRTVTLDGGTVAALREHRKRQAAERLLMGAGWTDIDLVFCHVDGTMPHPERFTRILRRRAPARTASAPATRSAARVGDVGAAGRDSPEGGTGAARPREHQHVVAGLHEDAADRVAALFVSNP